MGGKKRDVIWMTFSGQTIYENLNPYWSFCEKMRVVPDEIVIFHAIENSSGVSRIAKALSSLSRTLEAGHPVQISPVSFDDEDVQDFCNKAEERFMKYSRGKVKIFVDISPTTWSFVPVYLVKLAEKYGDVVKSINYIQYADNESRQRPYPLIPYKGILAHDFVVRRTIGKVQPH